MEQQEVLKGPRTPNHTATMDPPPTARCGVIQFTTVHCMVPAHQHRCGVSPPTDQLPKGSQCSPSCGDSGEMNCPPSSTAKPSACRTLGQAGSPSFCQEPCTRRQVHLRSSSWKRAPGHTRTNLPPSSPTHPHLPHHQLLPGVCCKLRILRGSLSP